MLLKTATQDCYSRSAEPDPAPSLASVSFSLALVVVYFGLGAVLHPAVPLATAIPSGVMLEAALVKDLPASLGFGYGLALLLPSVLPLPRTYVPDMPNAYFGAIAFAVAGGMAFLLVGLLPYRAAERKARRDGVIDRRLA